MQALVVTVCLLAGVGGGSAKDEPTFVGPSTNVTVVVGRDAVLTCKVEHLQNYKVAWLRVDTQTVLTLGAHVVTKNPRVAVPAPAARGRWALLVRAARVSDAGGYMCQLNTEPMRAQTHLLQVVVPPDIVESSGEVTAREGQNVSLHCSARGTPEPNITWRREDSRPIDMGSVSVSKWTGVWMNLSRVTRESHGAFLCIAGNGVPPTVSKRVVLQVLCAPRVNAEHKLVGGYSGTSVSLRCRVEANPLLEVYWTREDGEKLVNDEKYQADIKSEGFRHNASLAVRALAREDIGSYSCHVTNRLGSAKADFTLYTLAVTSTTPAPTTPAATAATAATTAAAATTREPDSDTSTEGKAFSADDLYVVVLSQHQMQMDLSPSL